jgi:hypothetical protein
MLDVTEQKPNQALKALVAMLGKEAKECGLPIIGKFFKDRQAQIKFYKPYNQLGFFLCEQRNSYRTYQHLGHVLLQCGNWSFNPCSKNSMSKGLDYVVQS